MNEKVRQRREYVSGADGARWIVCAHPNTAAAPGLERASVWCPDCKKWVVLREGGQ